MCDGQCIISCIRGDNYGYTFIVFAQNQVFFCSKKEVDTCACIYLYYWQFYKYLDV